MDQQRITPSKEYRMRPWRSEPEQYDRHYDRHEEANAYRMERAAVSSLLRSRLSGSRIA